MVLDCEKEAEGKKFMKNFKSITAVIVAVVIGFLAGALGMRMCGGTNSQIESNQEEPNQVDEADMNVYYGCPNSRRVKRLNLLKSRRVL